ncbi:MAG: D-alanine--D-alanine ligase [Woeseia sp.]|nr:D-alanine--D-alanine ligase [Woeseia sp.]
MIALSHDERIAVSDATDFGRVAVVYGGFSSEREISLRTGKSVLGALNARGVDAYGWDTAKHNLADLGAKGFDRVWIALHGPGGEDGAIQGVLEWMNIPYTGSGLLASALAMDKIASKRMFTIEGIPTPNYVVINDRADANHAEAELGFPMIIKPAQQGSSVGIDVVARTEDLKGAIETALSFGKPALAEKYVNGFESTVAVLQGEALASIRIETPRKFYDYSAKYESEQTQYYCPGIDDPMLERVYQDSAISAFSALGCSGWGRVDFMTGSDGYPQVIEINTVPGMTTSSLVPMAAKARDISFSELCWRVLETSFSANQESLNEGVSVNGP